MKTIAEENKTMKQPVVFHAPFCAVLVAGVALMIFATPATMSAKTSLVTAGTVRNVCGQPRNVKNHGESRSLNPVKTTFDLEGGIRIYYFQDRYSGEHIDVLAMYEFRTVAKRDGSFEVLRGRRVLSCEGNPAKG